MNEKKRIEFQNKMISRQSKEIDLLKSEIKNLELKIEEKDKLINSIDHLRNELLKNISDVKKSKDEYEELIGELRKMKAILNQTVYKGRWRIVKFLIK